MQSVQAPHLVARARAGRVRLAALALVAAVALAAGVVVGSREAPQSPSRSDVVLIGGVPLQQARCSQWNAGSEAERQAVVKVLARVAGGPATVGYGATLSPSQTEDLFARACSAPFAQGFLLYELYNRRAAFR